MYVYIYIYILYVDVLNSCNYMWLCVCARTVIKYSRLLEGPQEATRTCMMSGTRINLKVWKTMSPYVTLGWCGLVGNDDCQLNWIPLDPVSIPGTQVYPLLSVGLKARKLGSKQVLGMIYLVCSHWQCALWMPVRALQTKVAGLKTPAVHFNDPDEAK